MSLGRWLYRGRQFWLALFLRPAAQDLEQARQILSQELFSLFLQMQPGEQAHSFSIMKKLMAQGHNHPDLLVAALLHDVGKIRRRLRLWERVWIVLTKAVWDKRVQQWGNANFYDLDQMPIWQQPLVVAMQHPAWGADMVAAAGGSPLAVSLIRNHAMKPAINEHSLESRLLALLQFVDDNS